MNLVNANFRLAEMQSDCLTPLPSHFAYESERPCCGTYFLAHHVAECPTGRGARLYRDYFEAFVMGRGGLE